MKLPKRGFWIGWIVLPVLSIQVSAQETVDEIPNTQALDRPFTTPDQALEMITVPDGFHVTLFAAEPDVIQPIAVTTDARGRLWVVENLTYSDARQNYDTRLHDRIVIFEDRDQDGKFDSRKVFWDQGTKLTGIELGFGGVWLTSAPNLLFLPDRDHDDQPDGPPEVLLDGFNGDVIRHNIVNGLRWGPDGWLYGRHGIQATSFVGPPGATPSQRTPINCAIWRFHPTARRFEIVAQGGTNPWGFDYDDYGEMFMINTVIGHLFHVVPGARYRRMYGAHFNPHTYEVIEQTADHFHWDTREPAGHDSRKGDISSSTDAAGGGHAHTGLMIYLGDNWPQRYRNQLFTANFHGRRLNCERIERMGNGYVGRHEPDFMKTRDPWFRGVELLYGPDGGVYALDWSDIGECHENDGIHRTSGRIFKITYGSPPPPTEFDLTRWNDAQLVACHRRENQWYVRHARRLLQERAVGGGDLSDIRQQLMALCAEYDPSTQTNQDSNPRDVRPLLRAMWTLYSIGAADERFLAERLSDPNEHVRAWAVRLLTDGFCHVGRHRSEASEATASSIERQLIDMARSDPSGLVRLYLASSLPRFRTPQIFELAQGLVSHAPDAEDRTQPKLIWYGLEPEIVANPGRAIELARTSRIPLIRLHIVRRLTHEIESSPEVVDSLLAWLGDETRHEAKVEILTGIQQALQGWSKAPKPLAWTAVSKTLEKDARFAELTRQLNLVFGEGRALAELQQIATDGSASVEARRQAIKQLGKNQPDDLFSILKPLIRDKSLSNAVIEAMVHCRQPGTANTILNRFPHLDPAGKSLAITTLVARKVWAGKLLTAVQRGRIPKESISALHARQIRSFADEALNQKLAQVWGSVRETSAEKQETIEQIRQQLTEVHRKSANLDDGKRLFDLNCRNCHVLHGQGERIGPDLTGGDRKNLNYLLENIIDPSASVADSYRTTLIQMDDGRLISGVILQKTDRTLRLQTAEKIVTLDRRQIDETRPTQNSLMPDGLLDKLSEAEIINLFEYLMDQ